MLDGEELTGPVEPHLNLVHDQKNAVLVEHLLEFGKEILRRNDVAASALDRLHVECRELRLAGLGVPYAVVFAFEKPCELLHAMAAVLLLAHPLGSPEMIGERDKMSPVAKMAVAPTITIGGRYC